MEAFVLCEKKKDSELSPLTVPFRAHLKSVETKQRDKEMARSRDAHDWCNLSIASAPLSKNSMLHEKEKVCLRKARNEALAGRYQVDINLNSWEKNNNKIHWKRKFYKDPTCTRCSLQVPEDTVHILAECPCNSLELSSLVNEVKKEISIIIPEENWAKEGISLPIPENTKVFGKFSDRDPSTPLKINKPKRGRRPGPARGILNKKKELKWRKQFLGLLGYIPQKLIENLEKIGGRAQARWAAKNISDLTIKYSLNAIHQRNKSFGEWCKGKKGHNFNKDMFNGSGVIT